MAGNSILDRAESHFAIKRKDPLGSIEIPEWGKDGKALVVYVWPLNLRNKIDIRAAMEADEADGIALAFIRRAKTEEGKRMFADVEKTRFIRSVDPDVLSDAVNRIYALDKSQEEIRKN